MKKITIIIMILIILSKILGFGREITLAYFFGLTNITDAYLISLTIPASIFSFIGSGISSGFIPMYNRILKEKNEKSAMLYMNNLVNLLVCISTILILICLIFTAPIVKIFASGFTGETLQAAVKFTRISLIGIYFSGLLPIFKGFLQIKNQFLVPALEGIPYNLVIITFILLASRTNVTLLAISTVLALFSQVFLMIPFAIKNGYKYRFFIDFNDKNVRTMLIIALPLIIGASVNQINVLVDKTIASSIVRGGITALNNADKINTLVQGVFVLAISSVMFPLISKMVYEENFVGLRKTILESMHLVIIVVIPTTFGLMFFSTPIVKLLFLRGKFLENDAILTSSVLFYASIGIIGVALRDVLSKAFYSLQDTKTPMYNAGITVIVNIIFSLILSRYLGVGGSALATSIAAISSTLLLFINLKKKIPNLKYNKTIIISIKVLFSSVVMILVSKNTFNILTKHTSDNLSLLISIFIAVVVYSLIVLFMKIDEIDLVVSALRKKFFPKPKKHKKYRYKSTMYKRS